MSGFIFNDYSSGSEQRLLSVGGIHIFEGQSPCKLARVEPEGAVEDLKWVDTLALEARSEGDAEVRCGSERILLKIVAPACLEIKLVDDVKPTDIPVGEAFKVRALLYDPQGRELEVGRSTIIEWTSSGVLEVANAPSSGEFGFSDTSYGMHNFRAIKPGKGLITGCLGGLEGVLMVEATHSKYR